MHRQALNARRGAMLLWEKLLLHVDGSGDMQWADILYGTKVEIPRLVSEYRKSENLLRAVIDNAVAHHTTMPLRYFADRGPDRASVDAAIIDTLWINNLCYEQDFNALFAAALYLAKCTGFCPVHRYWRDDVLDDWYEPTGYGAGEKNDVIPLYAPAAPGMIDCWVGNPFDTVFDRAATRNSVRWASYARLLPAEEVRRHWSHVPGVRGLEGTTRIPSTAEFQRVARSWQMTGLGVHGSPVIDYRKDDEELITVICRETAPGVDSDWKKGHLEIVAVPGSVDMYRGENGAGNAQIGRAHV